MEESYIEGRFGIVMEEIRDALIGIETQLGEINKKMYNFEECTEARTLIDGITTVRMLRVADVTKRYGNI